MTQETIATDLLSLLAPLLASLLVSLSGLEAIRLRLAPRVPRVCQISPSQTGFGFATRARLSCAAGSPNRDPASVAARRPRSSASRPSPSAG
jgi:hypothetical protein